MTNPFHYVATPSPSDELADPPQRPRNYGGRGQPARQQPPKEQPPKQQPPKEQPAAAAPAAAPATTPIVGQSEKVIRLPIRLKDVEVDIHRFGTF